MIFIPRTGKVALEPILPSQARADEVRKRSGLLIAKPANKGRDFEGIPNQGRVFALPEAYDGPLSVGDRVIFTEQQLKGIRLDKKVLFVLDLNTIVATVPEED